MKLAALAEANNMKMEPHDFGGGTASLHVGLAIGNCDYYEQATPEGCFDSEIYPGVYLEPIRVDREGYVHAPTGPGPRLRHRPEGGREGRLGDPVTACNQP